MEPNAVQRQNKPLECRLILLGALRCILSQGTIDAFVAMQYTPFDRLWSKKINLLILAEQVSRLGEEGEQRYCGEPDRCHTSDTCW